MTVAALVVTHNRCELLRNCLSALLAQTQPLDEILVVDNNSSDDSVDMVRREFPAVHVMRSSTNIGGAGGFSLGVDALVERGHSFAWLMDDDAEPRHDALEPLIVAMEAAGRKPGFVASQVLSPDGTPIPTHVPLEIPEEENGELPTPAATYPAAHSTFVGVLINLETARGTFLPVADFFIWWDDIEYTGRLQSISGGLASTTSVVVHPNKPMWKDLGSRLRYDVRNRIWIRKCRGLSSSWGRERAAHKFWRDIWAQAVNARRKDLFLWNLGRGLWEGALTRPRTAIPTRPADLAQLDSYQKRTR